MMAVAVVRCCTSLDNGLAVSVSAKKKAPFGALFFWPRPGFLVEAGFALSLVKTRSAILTRQGGCRLRRAEGGFALFRRLGYCF